VNKFVLAPTTLPEVPPLDYIDAASHAGYDAVGLRLHKSPGLPFHPVVGDAPLIAEIKAMLNGANMPVFDIFSCYLEPDSKMSDFTASLALGAELGGKYIMLMGNDPEFPRMRDNFGLFCDEAKRFGLTATIEFVPTRPLCTMAMAARMIKETGRQNAVICLDPMHFMRTGGSAAEITALGARFFPYTQINDGVLFPGEPNPADFGRMRQGRRKMLGQGDVPLYAYLDALPQELPLSVEIPIELGAELRDVKAQPYSPREWAKNALQNARDFMQGYYASRNTPR
jgi:sugar phosphate isomerase/epimerase